MRNISLLIFLLFLGACQETPQLENFDKNTWQNDKMGCANKRQSLIENLKKQKIKLKGLGQNQVIQLLGKPDFAELYKRNQRFFVYFYAKGTQCEGKPNMEGPYSLQIRFSALDAVTEVIFN